MRAMDRSIAWRSALLQALLIAAVAGIPSLVAVAAGVHWLGVVVGVPLFALWCGRLARDRHLLEEVV